MATQETGSRQPVKHHTLTERATLRMGEVLMQNYDNPNKALFDLVDNAVDNRIEGKPLAITVRVSRDTISISNSGGYGLDLLGLDNFLTWGHSEKTDRDIGQYGVGGKAAMGFLGNSVIIHCSPQGTNADYRLEIPNFRTSEEISEKQHDVTETTTPNSDGYFSVQISNLNTERIIRADQIAELLGDTYKPLLEKGAVNIRIIRGTRIQEVEALEIKYLQDDPNFTPDIIRVQSGFGDIVPIRIGVLEGNQKVKPGFRLYYRGRLIEDGHFFGHPTPAQLPAASRLIGEIDLDKLRVTPNKEKFIKDARWEDTMERIRVATQPYIDKLRTLPIEQTHEIEAYERHMASDVKAVVDHIAAETGIFVRGDLPGGANRRREPTKQEEPRKRPKTTRRRGEQTGETAPTIDATVEGRGIKRWGVFHAIEPVSMGNSQMRSELVQEDGRAILRVNSDFPAYQTEKMAGHPALHFYIALTTHRAALSAAYPNESVDFYMQKEDEFLRHYGEFYGDHLRQMRFRRPNRPRNDR